MATDSPRRTDSQPMNYVFPPPPPVSVPVRSGPRFPVHRIYCVGRNYAEHAKEMGHGGGAPPLFFLKPADAVLAVEEGRTGELAYPALTRELHHEVELVVAVGEGGRDITAAEAPRHVFGYAVGLDMTRRDLQARMKQQAGPWDIGKAFDQAAPIGPITPVAQAGDIARAGITLHVNGELRQRGSVDQMICTVPEIIAQLSAAWELRPGDLIYTGTPAGVAAVQPGDALEARITGLETLRLRIA